MPIGRREILLLAVLAMAGCTTPALPKGTSPLMPAQMSPDSVVLEMFFVRVPLGDPGLNERLWEGVDEQRFAPELRERLARNGFRAGLLSGQMPAELTKIMELSEKPPPTGEAASVKAEDLEKQPQVVRRHQQLRAGREATIIASNEYAELPVLMSEPGELCGQTYHQARGIFSIKSFPQPDGRVRLAMVPEVEHDQAAQRWITDHGMMRLDVRRPTRTFDELALTAELTPGAMLILSNLPNRPGSLGHQFFTEKADDGRTEQKLLLIRLVQTQHDGLFSPPAPLRLEESP
jgi:tetrahydromethanopterin S-methyltransferase subunit F